MLPWTGSCDFRSWPLNSHAHWYGLPRWEIHFLLDLVSEITLRHHSFLLSLKGINETWHQKFICKVVFYYILRSGNAFLDSCNKRRWGKEISHVSYNQTYCLVSRLRGSQHFQRGLKVMQESNSQMKTISIFTLYHWIPCLRLSLNRMC